MKVLGCTGGIGSGKSYVSRIFGKLGYPVYFSDDRAKMLYDTDPLLLQQMAQLLGSDILTDGKLNRRAVAEKIFSDSKMLAEVEKMVHPAVIRDFEKWKREQCNGGSAPDFVIFESAILLEKPLVRTIAHKVLVVAAPEQLRIARVMARDGVTSEEVQRRMASQWSDSQRIALADFIIFADSKRALIPQIEAVIKGMGE